MVAAVAAELLAGGSALAEGIVLGEAPAENERVGEAAEIVRVGEAVAM
jgi:hypothetical protein